MVHPIAQGAYFGAHAVTALVTVGLGYWTLARSNMRAKRWFTAWLFDLGAWSLAAAVSVVAGESLQPALYVCRSLLGATAVPLAVAFAAAYTGRRLRGNPVITAVTAVYAVLVPLILTALVHDRYWESITTYTEPFPHMGYEPGVGWVLLMLYSVTGTAVLLYYFVDLYQRSRHHISLALLSIGGGLVLALVPLVLSELDLLLIGTYNHTPFGISIVALSVTYAVTRQGLYDIEPIARDEVVDDLEDPFFTIDREGRLIDYNPAAQQLVGEIASADIGRLITDVFPQLPLQVEQFPNEWQVADELALGQNGHSRYFDVNTTQIEGPRGETQGGLIVLREITLLKEREHQLDLLRQLQSRVLRHNLRNDINVITAYTQLLAEKTEDADDEMVDVVLSTAEDMVTLSEKARLVEELIERKQTETTIDLTTVLSRSVETVREAFPAVSIRLDCPDSCRVPTAQPLEVAFENLVENAAEHNDAADPVVEVSVSAADEVVVVEIVDNGPGIPDNELGVLDQNTQNQLEHGSGVGLWAIDWIISESAGSISYETGPDGTAVTVRHPMAGN